MERAGHECVGACEWDEYARRVYARRFPKTKIWKDARQINPKELPDFDCLCAGFPCQAFSIAGKRLGFTESRGTVFYEIIRIAREKRPKFLLLENVEGLLSAGFKINSGFFESTKGDGKGEITNDLQRVKDEPLRGWEEVTINIQKGQCFLQILSALEEIGYSVQGQVLNSKFFVPQNRSRIFLVGYLGGKCGPKIFPLGEINRTSHKTLSKRKLSDQVCTTLTSIYYKGGNGNTVIVEPENKKIKMYALSHTKANMKQRCQERDNTWTLDTSGSKMAVEYMGRVRRLTPTECELLQGFKKGWTDELSDMRRYKSIGNAVTTDVVEYVAKALNKGISDMDGNNEN